MNIIYVWYGYDVRGRLRRGRVQAHSRARVIQRLLGCGIAPVACRFSFWSLSRISWWKRVLRVRIVHRTLSAAVAGQLCRDTAALLQAGRALVPALGGVAQTHRSSRHIITELQQLLLSGLSLADALIQQRIWPSVVCAAVAAGEGHGHLGEVLAHLGSACAVHEQTIRQLRQALLIPLLTLCVGVLVVIGMFVYIVPYVSKDPQCVLTWWYVGLAGLLAVAAYCLPAEWRGRIVYYFPLFGVLYTTAHSVMVVRLLAVVLQAGQRLPEAFDAVSEVPGNRFWRHEYRRCAVRLRKGVPLARVIADVSPRVMPALVRHAMLCAADQSRLAVLLAYTADRLHERLSYLLTTRLLLVQPLLLIIIGGGVAVVLSRVVGQLTAHVGDLSVLS